MVVGGSAAVAGIAASIHKPDRVTAQQSSENNQEQQTSGKRLEGKVAVVTGSARAIGRACAVSLASEGADVVVMDIANPDAFPYLNYPMASMRDLAETKRLVEK